MDLDKLFDIQIKSIKYKEVPKYTSIIKDMAFVLDNNVNVGDVISTIYKKGGRVVTNVDVFDVFNNFEKDKKSIAFKITFQDLEKTLTEDEVLKLFNNIIDFIEKDYKAKLRNK